MSDIWLVGAGDMAQAYISVLDALEEDFLVIGRGTEMVDQCQKKTLKPVYAGGLEKFLEDKMSLRVPKFAIVAVPVEHLYSCACMLMQAGVKNILIEKPAGLNKEQIEQLHKLSLSLGAAISVAYNRRFYASVLDAVHKIEQDGGVISCHFEFTEWAHIIANLSKPDEVFQKWFFANSTHVVDLAFHIIGKPHTIHTISQAPLDWHSSGSIFCGTGLSIHNIPFTYHANWAAPGRWGVEFLTCKNRYIFRPMEELRIVQLGSIKEEPVLIDNSLDVAFKPGVYRQTKSFLQGDLSRHCSLAEQVNMMDIYYEMANYQ